ncbi:MAG: hypothetical protein IKT32_02160 [Clostridia bacterium]|nr:hypothetical protein [Clostridia bacterium]
MCYDFNSAYQGYSNDKNYLCVDTYEMMRRATERLMGELPEDNVDGEKSMPL